MIKCKRQGHRPRHWGLSCTIITPNNYQTTSSEKLSSYYLRPHQCLEKFDLCSRIKFKPTRSAYCEGVAVRGYVRVVSSSSLIHAFKFF